MLHTDYGREKYIGFMFNYKLFISVLRCVESLLKKLTLFVTGLKPLKVTSCSSKMENFPLHSMLEQVRCILADFGLLEFTYFLLTMLDASLLFAFVER